MPFLDPKAITVPARASCTPRSYSKILFSQCFDQGEAGHIDRCCITQRLPSLHCHAWIAKFGSGPVSLSDVAVMATEHEIGYAIRATTTPWHHMVQFKRHILCTTIDAAPAKLFEQIGSCFPSCQLPSLVEDTCYLWILHQSQIKLDLLHLDLLDGCPPAVAARPGHNVANA